MFRWEKAWEKELKRKAEEYFPGKTQEEINQVYQEFFEEFDALRNEKERDMNAILDCLKRYEKVLELCDLRPELQDGRWSDYRNSIEYMLKHGDSLDS